MQMPIPGRKGDGKYKLADYNYDIKHGYIEHAAFSAEPTRAECMAAWEETKTYYHLACLTTTGGEPQSRKQAIESGNWLGPDGWYATELAEMEALERMGVFRWVKMTEVPNGTKLLGNKFVYKDKCPMPINTSGYSSQDSCSSQINKSIPSPFCTHRSSVPC